MSVTAPVATSGRTDGGSGPERGRRTTGGQEGSALVEFALVLPLLLVLLMGIIDMGFALSELNSLRQGVRESARRAVVSDVSGVAPCTILGAGAPNADTTAVICRTKAQTGLDAGTVRVAVHLDPSWAEGNALVVCAQHDMRSITRFFAPLLDGRTMSARVSMRIETTDDNGTPVTIVPYEELGNWGSCP